MRTIFGTKSLFLLGMLTAFALMSLDATADDVEPSIDGKPAESTPEKPASNDPPKERSLLEKLGDGLLQEIDDTPGGTSTASQGKVDKMERAIKGMRNAGDKLDEGLTKDETQKIQKQVIKDLEDIINELENPPPQSGGGGGGGGGKGGGASSKKMSRSGSGSMQKMRRPAGGGGQNDGHGQQKPKSGSSNEQDGGETSENGTDSSKAKQAARKAAEDAERRRKLEMDIWGHLPLHLREELLSTYGERMLPKYEHLVKQFYESLSTQGDPKHK